METLRPPVVTILGHVDHGKTTLLDFIRKTAVADKEFGGITQSIGAYQAEAEGKLITFIDTPGHAAFEKMRERGAGVADIAVLVVAVDDGIMPQTVEAIKHIQKAGVNMIVAVNKIDLPGINVKVQLEKIKKQLSDNHVLIEEYGGDVPIVSLSAKTGEGVDALLSTINLVAEIQELKGDPEKQAQGVILESRLDKARGSTATVLVRDGSLKKGDLIKAGSVKGRVKGMFDWSGKNVDVALPSTPVEVLGFEQAPEVGSKLGEEIEVVVEQKSITNLIDRLKEDKDKILNVILRADTQGSLEALKGIIEDFNSEEKHIKIISFGTGEIVDSDVETAAATKAIVLGFRVDAKQSAKRLAELSHTLIRTYNVIYELGDEIGEVVEAMLKPGRLEEVFARVQILAEFPYGKNEKIAGCKVMDGTLSKGPKIRIVREGEVITEGKIKSLKKLKEEVAKVDTGAECGIIFDGNLEFQIGDIVESFRTF